LAKKKKPLNPNQKSRTVTSHSGSSEKNNWVLYGALALFAFVLYANTIGHGYVLDDASTITENHFVKQGLSGIGNILTSEYRAGYWVSEGNLYRPLSLIMFNIEWTIAPDNPMLPHTVNVLLYVLTCLVLYRFISKMPIPNAGHIALISTLLFIAHPIHTEVVANIKSRDEILSLLFGLVFLYYWFKPSVGLFSKDKIISLLALSLSLFSKESSLIFIPIAMLYSFLFRREAVKNIVRGILPAFIPAFVYLAARFAVVGSSGGGTPTRVDNALMDVAGSPDYYASAFAYLFQYLKLLVFPHPLACDYGFAQIPLTGFADLNTWLGILFFSFWIAVFLLFIKRQPFAAFGAGVLLGAMILPSNLIVTIGTSLAERLLYLPSVGFCIVIGGMIVMLTQRAKALQQGKKRQYGMLAIAAVFVLPGSFKTIDRNKDWKSVRTLYYTDIKTSPNSSKMNVYYGLERVQEALEQSDQTLRNEYMQDALNHFVRASEITPESHDAWHQMGLARYRLGRYQESETAYQQALSFKPRDPKLYNNYGVLLSEMNRHADALEQYSTAVSMDSRYVDAHRNLGVTHALQGNFQEALRWLKEAHQLNPEDANVILFIGLTYDNLNQPNEGTQWKERAYAMNPALRN